MWPTALTGIGPLLRICLEIFCMDVTPGMGQIISTGCIHRVVLAQRQERHQESRNGKPASCVEGERKHRNELGENAETELN